MFQDDPIRPFPAIAYSPSSSCTTSRPRASFQNSPSFFGSWLSMVNHAIFRLLDIRERLLATDELCFAGAVLDERLHTYPLILAREQGRERLPFQEDPGGLVDVDTRLDDLLRGHECDRRTRGESFR